MDIKTISVYLILGIVVTEARIFGRKLREGEPCDTPGFFGDADDCRKFYRCAEHPTSDPNNPHLIRYSFRCPNGTVWDEALSTCNHPEAVMDKPANCQVYDPDDGQGDNWSSWNSQPILGLGFLQNQLHLRQDQAQHQQNQQLLVPVNQIVYPTIPYLVPQYG